MTHVLRKSLMLAAMVAAFAIAQAGNAVAQTSAVLDLTTGEISLNIGGGILIVGLEGVAFDTSATSNDSGLGAPSQNDAGGIGFLNFSGLPEGGPFNIGSVIPENLRTPDGVADFVLRYSAAGQSEVEQRVGDPGVTVIPAIPEPGSLSLLALAGLGAVARRRR